MSAFLVAPIGNPVMQAQTPGARQCPYEGGISRITLASILVFKDPDAKHADARLAES